MIAIAALAVLAAAMFGAAMWAAFKAFDWEEGWPMVGYVVLALVFLYGAFYAGIACGDRLDQRWPAVVVEEPG